MTTLSVLIPVHADAPHLASAIESVLEQTYGDFELLLLMNGVDPDGPAAATARDASSRDSRVRIVDLPRTNLSTALNAGLREAAHPIVARMDADDLSHPDRFTAQLDFLRRNPGIVAVGTAYERIGEHAEPISTVYPPCEPREVRWRLLLGNTFAHGSMMMRREAVLRAGGYDESCARAQDYELWTRLARSGELANLPGVYYRYRTSPERSRPDPEQAITIARVMLREWGMLPQRTADADLAPALATLLCHGRGGREAMASIVGSLQSGPSVGALLAQLVASQATEGHRPEIIEAGRLSRLRELSAKLRWYGVPDIWLWGAGRHTEWVLAHEEEIGQSIVGVVDDRRAGERIGFLVVRSPDDLPPDAHVLLSSDAWEDELWHASAGARARGVTVWRFYGEQSPTENKSHAGGAAVIVGSSGGVTT